jgi:hypothetical protein
MGAMRDQKFGGVSPAGPRSQNRSKTWGIKIVAELGTHWARVRASFLTMAFQTTVPMSLVLVLVLVLDCLWAAFEVQQFSRFFPPLLRCLRFLL